MRRWFWVRVHRLAGLSTALFLTVAGLTGSAIAFHHELDRLLNPAVLRGASSGPHLGPSHWVAAAEAAHPRAHVYYVALPRRSDDAVHLYLKAKLNPGTGQPYVLEADQVFVDPSTARVLGSRQRGAFKLDRLHLMPWLYELHMSLHMGRAGTWLLGIVALVWFLDTLVGLYLAWPKHTWKAVKQAFGVRLDSTRSRVNFDFHRAGGLWIWPVLMVVAFSGAAMAFHAELFEPALKALARRTPEPRDLLPSRPSVARDMPFALHAATARAERALAAGGVVGGRLGSIWVDWEKAVYVVGFHTDHDVMHEHPGTFVTVSGSTGDVLGVRVQGGSTIGDAVHDWQFPLHSGKAFGLTGRIAIAVVGVLVAMLSVTGVFLWARKRRDRVSPAWARGRPAPALNTSAIL